MRDSEDVTFAGGTLDRAAHLRTDAAALTAMQRQASTRALALWHGKPLLDISEGIEIVWLPLGSPVLKESTTSPIFLGLQNGAPRFAFDVSGWNDPAMDAEAMRQFRDTSRNHHPALPDTQQFIDLRSVMAELPHADAGDAATAKGIFEWHRTHCYCASCGAPSEVSQAGWQRECPECGHRHFPRTDPVVIMLVTNGNDVLLGRSPHWPEGMFSLLAGFMEPGEGIEEAVRREVFEETGVTTGRVSYLSSQPWPFPSSLMIGCHAIATSRDITIDSQEIEAAMWISREDLAESMLGHNPAIAPTRKGSIARFLLDRWLNDTLKD